MIEKYKELIKTVKILAGYEEYRKCNGYSSRHKAIIAGDDEHRFEYSYSNIMIRYNSNGSVIRCRHGLIDDLNRTDISMNRLYLSEHSPSPAMAIRFKDDYFGLRSSQLSKYELTVADVLTEENYFQYSLVENKLPEIKDLKNSFQVFNLLQESNVGYIGPYEFEDINFNEFIRQVAIQTPFAREYWEDQEDV